MRSEIMIKGHRHEFYNNIYIGSVVCTLDVVMSGRMEM
jgi:hypothetical protein